eukprot:Lankesteria_metandrocarpae@DN4338_c0_g2_i1.p3
MSKNSDQTFDVSWMPFLRSCPDMAHSEKWDPEGFLSPFQSTPSEEQLEIIRDVKLTTADTFLDLGCGDGGILVQCATLFGCKSVGIELDADLCEQARAAAKKASVDDLVEIINIDFTKPQVDEVLAHASVVFIYLIPSATAVLSPKLISWLGSCPCAGAGRQSKSRRRVLLSFLWSVSELKDYEIQGGGESPDKTRRYFMYGCVRCGDTAVLQSNARVGTVI